MGYEVKYIFHPRKEDGPGYDTEKREEKVVKVGKPFEDISLENLAAAVMSQMARRDIWVIDVEIVELVRKEVAFKECKDGKGIMLKNKRYSFNEAAQMVAEDVIEETCPVQYQQHPHELVPLPNVQVQHPHELITHQRQQTSIDDLYGNPNKPVPVVKQNATAQRAPVNQKRVLYKVYFDPPIQYVNEVKRMNLKFKPDKEYPVHQVIPHPSGRLDAQKIVVSDDFGRPIEVDEKFFVSAGQGLFGDNELHFSGSNGRGVRKPKLAFEDEMYMDAPDPKMAGRSIPEGIPIDDGTVPDNLMAVPDIRRPRR